MNYLSLTIIVSIVNLIPEHARTPQAVWFGPRVNNL